MEAWSDLPVRERFRIKFYLDTNILAYLVDNTYSGLTQAILYLKDSAFADLISSKYVVFEFVGIRKREHYLREVVTNSKSATSGILNMGSLLKYRDNFEAPEVNFDLVQANIKQNVMQELNDIVNNFKIYYDKNIFHDSLLPPTFDITLSSKISREDSLMLTSSIWADVAIKEEFIFLMSNDKDFVKNFTDENLDAVFTAHNLSKPHVEHIRSMQESNAHKLNLTNPADDMHLATYLPTKLKETIIKKNEQYFLGKTIHPGNGAGFPVDVICFCLNANIPLSNNIYLTIIGKDLDFIYSTKLPVASFWNQVEITSYPFQDAAPVNISFRPLENISGTPSSLPANILIRLREVGNLIFINPD